MTNRLSTVAVGHDDHPGGPSWQRACRVERIGYDRGCAVIFPDSAPGRSIAIFRLPSLTDQRVDQWYAIDHIDPVSGMPVMARGLVGSAETPAQECPTVTSPLYKQRYDLRTGRCLDDAQLSVLTYPVRINEAYVEVFVTVTTPQQPRNSASSTSPS